MLLDERAELGAVVVDEIFLAAVLTQLLADRAHLLAQEELALVLLDALAHVLADLLVDLEFGQSFLRPLEHLLEASLDVDGLEQLDLALEGEVGPPAGEVGELRRILDVVQHLGEAPAPEPVEQRADDRTDISRELDGPLRGRTLVDGLGVDPQRRRGADDTGTDVGAADRPNHEGGGAPGQRALVLDLGDGADSAVAAAVGEAGDEQQLALAFRGGVSGGPGLIGLQGEGDDHLGQHDPAGERKYGQGADVQVLGIGAVSVGAFGHVGLLSHYQIASEG